METLIWCLQQVGILPPKEKQPDVHQLRHQAALRALQLAATGVVGAYSVALLYKVGAFAKVLPQGLNDAIESRVNRLKELTEPRVDAGRFNAARSHLMQVYAATAGFCGLSALGSAAFFAAPYLPIGVPVALTAVPAAALALTPRRFMSEPGRVGLSLLAVFSCGYSFGPMNWIAYDSVLPFACVVGATFVGFGVPLYLTRGVVSYFLSTQLLSGSLAIIAASSFKASEDVNVLLTAQLIANAALGLLHTVPTILEYVRDDDTEADPKKTTATRGDAAAAATAPSRDVLLEALGIYGALAWFTWNVFRLSCLTIFRRMTKDEGTGLTHDERRKLERFASLSNRVESASDIAASVLFLLLYIKVVGHIQRTGNSVKKLDALRKVFARMSPLSLIN